MPFSNNTSPPCNMHHSLTFAFLLLIACGGCRCPPRMFRAPFSFAEGPSSNYRSSCVNSDVPTTESEWPAPNGTIQVLPAEPQEVSTRTSDDALRRKIDAVQGGVSDNKRDLDTLRTKVDDLDTRVESLEKPSR